MTRDSGWAKRGEQAVGAAADLVVGIGRGFASLGSRLKRSQYQAFADGLCAVAGDVASQNGRLKPEEIEAFRSFVLENRSSPALKPFDPAELTESFKDFAVKAFLCDEGTFARVVDQTRAKAEGQSELGQLILLGAVAIAFADGEADDRERETLARYAERLEVDLDTLIERFLGHRTLPEPEPVAVLEATVTEIEEADPPVASVNPGEKLDLTGERAVLELRWRPEQVAGGDVDASAFVLGPDGKVSADEDFVFYNNPSARAGAVAIELHPGTCRLTVHLRTLGTTSRVALAVTLPEGAALSALDSLDLEVEGLARFTPSLKGRDETALIVAELYHRKERWRFHAVGQGFAGGLAKLAAHYGVDVG